MSLAPTPNRSRNGSVPTDVARGRSLSVSAIQKAQRGSRRESMLPLCMSREQHAALHALGRQRKPRGSGAASGKSRLQTPPAASPANATTANAATTANGWMALLAHPDANQEIARAVQMCSVYPTLRVAGTAFENSLNMAHRMSAESFSLPSNSRRGTELIHNGSSAANRDDMLRSPRMSTSVLLETSSMLREAVEERRAFFECGSGSGGAGGIGRRSSLLMSNSAAAEAVARAIALNGGTKMVQMACAMKRAAMWEVVVVIALAHRAMELEFRRDRLRRVLKRHLLPTLMARKEATGTVLAKRSNTSNRGNNSNGGLTNRHASEDSTNGDAASTDSGSAPQGSYLRDHDAFFASLNSPALLQSFAETMTRYRFLPGEVIVRAGQFSQKAMYFLISGKCEVTKDRSEVAAEADADDDDSAATPTYRDGMHSTKAPCTSEHGVPESCVSRCVKEVLRPGATFGGIFGGSAVFAATYRALSQCIVWELRCEDFEKVFRPFSDRAMLDKYKECMRAESLAWLQQHYQPEKVFGSIPVYRRLVSRKARYLGDFTPVAMVRGELLFAQDALPGDVYCLLEGTVLRRTKEKAGGDDGVAQRLATNAFSSLRAMGRFLLLGEEPHILPGVQPYSCTVSSRVALFYRIPGERFVSALLDDPVLYAQLRERLMKQRQANMVLDPDCLAYVPLLQRFPAEKRAELVQFAQPRVVGRSASLCDPAQHLSELMLVVSGDVCDPRRYGEKPTTPLKAPATGSGDANNGDADGAGNTSVSGGGMGDEGNNTGVALVRQMNSSLRHSASRSSKTVRRRQKTGAAAVNSRTGSELDGANATTTTLSTRHRPPQWGSTRESVTVRNSANLFDGDDSDADASQASTVAQDAVGVEWDFSIPELQVPATLGGSGAINTEAFVTAASNTNGGEVSGLTGPQRAHLATQSTASQHHQKLCQTAAIVYPDESEEINPPPPSQPTRSFLYAVGGSWEALLLDKWPNGWESTTTVALWAIPTYKLRLVYNSCSKATQSYILNGLRLAQKEAQHLPSIPHTKMPPMTVYTQRGEAALLPGAGEASGPSTARASFRRRPAKQQQQQADQPSQSPPCDPAASLPFAVPSEAASSFSKAAEVSGAAVSQSIEDPLGDRKKPPHRASGKVGAIAVPSGAPQHEAKSRLQSSPSARSNAAATPSTTQLKANGGNHNGKDLRSTDGTPRGTRVDSAARTRAAVNGKTSGNDDASRLGLTRQKTIASAPLTPTSIDPAVKAAYDGVFDAADPLMLRIVRDPVVASAEDAKLNKSSAKRAVALAGRSLPPLPSSPDVGGGGDGTLSPATWPSQTPAQDRWFQVVPSYEPLPGTARAAETLAAPPVFSPNTAVLASAGVGPSSVHRKTLESHVAYYAASVLSGAASTTKRSDAAGKASAAVVSPHPLPKRRAYAA